jgi:hypothetical protein
MSRSWRGLAIGEMGIVGCARGWLHIPRATVERRCCNCLGSCDLERKVAFRIPVYLVAGEEAGAAGDGGAGLVNDVAGGRGWWTWLVDVAGGRGS